MAVCKKRASKVGVGWKPAMPGSSKGAGVEVTVGVEVGGRVEVTVALGRRVKVGFGVDVGIGEALGDGDGWRFVGLAEGRMFAVGVLGSQAVRSRVSPKSDTRMSR